MSYDPDDVGGDPACWLHLFEDDGAGEAEDNGGDAAAAEDADGTTAADAPSAAERDS